MKKDKILTYLENKIKLYTRKYRTTDNKEYLYGITCLQNAMFTLKEVK